MGTFGGLITRTQPTGSKFPFHRILGTTAVGLMVATGTGGVLTPELYQQATQRTRPQEHPHSPLDSPAVRSPKEDLDRIRSVLKPAISDLAAVLGVSRQSIYNWINGEAVAEENAAKLQDLAQAADLFVREGIDINMTLMKRKFDQGRTLLQVAQAGESAYRAAHVLIDTIKQEAIQRACLNARLGNRPSPVDSPDADFPAANEPAQG